MLLGLSQLWSLALFCVSLLHQASGDFSYVDVANQDNLQHGDGTFYGHQQDQDSHAACSYSENRAGTMNLTWTTGAAVSLAMNSDQFNGSKACGMCVMYRGVGGGIGVTPISTTSWFMGFVNNICPECERGSLDQDIDGDGRWKIEWYGVPCNVGNTKLEYTFVVKQYYWFELVISNTRIPISAVSVKINGKWLDLRRSVTNTWPYYRENGDWQGNFPMPVRITSALNETLEDTITSQDGNTGKVQFREIPGPAYVSADVPGRGIRPRNAFALKNGVGAVPNIEPIKNATAYGAPGWSNSSTRALSRQIPSTAASTSSVGSIYSASTFQVDDGAQCGGTGGECTARDRGEPTRPCIPGAWPLALCAKSSSTCQPQSEERWACHPSPLGASTASNASSSPSTSPSPGSSSASPGPSASLSASQSPSSSPSSSPSGTPSSSATTSTPASPSSQSAVPYKAESMSGTRQSPSSGSPPVYNLAAGDSPSPSSSSSSPSSSPTSYSASKSSSSPSSGSSSRSGSPSSGSPSYSTPPSSSPTDSSKSTTPASGTSSSPSAFSSPGMSYSPGSSSTPSSPSGSPSSRSDSTSPAVASGGRKLRQHLP